MPNEFTPSTEYLTVLALLPQLTLAELGRLRIQDIHREQLDRQGRIPQNGDEAAKVGKRVVHGRVAN